MNKSQWASQETRKYYEDQERAKASSPDNYKILRQRIQEYAAHLISDGEGDKKFAEQMNLPSCKILGERKINIAKDLSDILQALPNE